MQPLWGGRLRCGPGELAHREYAVMRFAQQPQPSQRVCQQASRTTPSFSDGRIGKARAVRATSSAARLEQAREQLLQPKLSRLCSNARAATDVVVSSATQALMKGSRPPGVPPLCVSGLSGPSPSSHTRPCTTYRNSDRLPCGLPTAAPVSADRHRRRYPGLAACLGPNNLPVGD